MAPLEKGPHIEHWKKAEHANGPKVEACEVNGDKELGVVPDVTEVTKLRPETK